MSVYIPK